MGLDSRAQPGAHKDSPNLEKAAVTASIPHSSGQSKALSFNLRKHQSHLAKGYAEGVTGQRLLALSFYMEIASGLCILEMPFFSIQRGYTVVSFLSPKKK